MEYKIGDTCCDFIDYRGGKKCFYIFIIPTSSRGKVRQAHGAIKEGVKKYLLQILKIHLHNTDGVIQTIFMKVKGLDI